jgi:fatty-acyl-CoA synthase
MNWRLTVTELRYIVADCQPVVLFHDAEFSDTATQLAEACSIPHLVGRGPEGNGYENLIATSQGDSIAQSLCHDDVATILYTSGTTGHPKGAIITHGMRVWQAINNTGPARLTSQSATLMALPQFHAAGLETWANPVFHCGGKVIVMRAYDPGITLRLLGDREMNVTHFLAAPAHFLFMAQLAEFSAATFNPGLYACVAAAPMPFAQLQLWQSRGLALVQAYGMTETCGLVTIMEPDRGLQKPGSAGQPCLHVSLRLVRTDGGEALTGEVGEIWVRGPVVTPGYWNQPEATAAAITDGWLRTGDAATIDADGFVTIVDRWKDMYISGGENVYPAEVEDVLYRLPAIAEAAIIGVPDDRWGEVGRAIITMKPGEVISEAEIMRHCEANLARYKHPRSFCFVDALPRNATGKVHKPTLRQRFGAI